MAAGELARRVAVAAVGLPLAVIAIYLGGWFLGVPLALLAALGSGEVYALAATRGVRAFRLAGGALSATFVALAASGLGLATMSVWLWVAVLAAALGTAVASLWLRGVDADPLGASAVTVYGAVFVGGSLSFALLLRDLVEPARASWGGAALVAYPLAVTWIGDTLAYFCGKRWGRHKLSAVISPRKTVEGAVAGLIGSIGAGALVGWLVFDLWLGWPIGAGAGAVGGLLIGPVAQIGDLAESLFKRAAGVKDSGTFFPGHGGILDRFDALFLALPVAWVYLTLLLPLAVDLPWR